MKWSLEEAWRTASAERGQHRGSAASPPYLHGGPNRDGAAARSRPLHAATAITRRIVRSQPCQIKSISSSSLHETPRR